MQYAQLNEALTEAIQINTRDNVEWDSTHFCPASALTPAEAEYFRVVPLLETAQPEFNRITQSCQRSGSELVDGQWRYKWLVSDLTPEQVASNQTAAIAAVIENVTKSTQARLDAFARTRSYDNILSACTYASSLVPRFASDGQYAVDMRDTTWETLYQFMTAVQLGTKPMPSGFADVEPLLPVLAWPA